MAAAISMLGAPAGHSVVTPIDSITTTTVNGASTTRSTVGNDPADVTYTGEQRAMTSFTVGADTYVPAVEGQVFVRRNTASEVFSTSNANQVQAWTYQLADNGGGPPPAIDVAGEYHNTFESVLFQNSIRTGAENVFINNEGAGFSTNVERVDFIFDTPIVVTADHSFALLERGGGGSGANIGFRIAAITSLGAPTLPDGFGSPVLVADSAYSGASALVAPDIYNIYRYNVSGGPELDYRHESTSNQHVVGLSIPATDVVTTGTSIYGYSLFAKDVTAAAGADLVDWTNTTFFPVNTVGSDGDVDMGAIAARLWTSNPVPEPSSLILFAFAGALFLVRRARLPRR